MTNEERVLLLTLAYVALAVFEKQGATETAALLRANLAAVEHLYADTDLAQRLHRVN